MMRRFPLVLALLFSGISQAELTVVADLGGSQRLNTLPVLTIRERNHPLHKC